MIEKNNLDGKKVVRVRESESLESMIKEKGGDVVIRDGEYFENVSASTDLFL